MNEQNNNPSELEQRYRRLNQNFTTSRSFKFFNIFVISLILSPIFVILGGLFLAQILNIYNIRFDLFPLFLAYIVFYVSLILTLLVFGIVILILSIVISLISYKRTKYKGYLYESLIEMQLLLLPVIGVLLFLFSQDNIMIIYLFYIILPFEYKLIKKPLIYSKNAFFWPFNQNSLNQETSDILIKQSVFINSFEDGYSSRSVFEDISNILKSLSKEKRKESLERYAKFLSINGDLIGYDINEQKIHLYLRTTFIRKIQMYNIFVFIKKVKQLIKKDGLTSITIDLDSLEMNFKTNKFDYELLDDLTFHELNLRVLNQFKKSIKNFISENYVESYEELNPKPISKNSSFLRNRLMYFLAILYICGAIFFGPVLTILLNNGNVKNFSIGVTILMWPLLLYFYLFSLHNSFNGNISLIISNKFIELLLISIFSLIVLLISLTTFHLIDKHEKNSVKEINREIKFLQK